MIRTLIFLDNIIGCVPSGRGECASLNPKGDRKAKLITLSHFITFSFKNDKSFAFLSLAGHHMLPDGKHCAHMSDVLDNFGAASGWCGLNGIGPDGLRGERMNINHW